MPMSVDTTPCGTGRGIGTAASANRKIHLRNLSNLMESDERDNVIC